MLKTTVGQLLINDALPEKMRDWTRTLDKKGTSKLFTELAKNHPELYREVAQKILRVGRIAATESGGYSFGLKDLRMPPEAKKLKDALSAEIDAIYASKLPDNEMKQKVVETIQRHSPGIEKKLFEEALAAKNPLALQVVSGARGTPTNIRSVIGGDLLYEDHRGRPVPIPALRSYSQGTAPHEYWAGTFGARKGVIDVQNATSDAGFFNKQLNQATHRLVVTGHDDEKEDLTRGVPYPVDDADNAGALLAQPAGGYPRNTILTPKILADLQAKGVEKLLLRSPMVGGPEHGGLYARDVGVRERSSGLPPIGDNVGIAAASALGEIATQAGLCLMKGTLVRMADWSTKPIEEVKVGDYVLGSDLEGKTAPTKVVRVYNNGLRECHETTFKQWMSHSRARTYAEDTSIKLRSTLDHKIVGVTTHLVCGKREGNTKLVPVGTTDCKLFAKLATGGFDDKGCVAEPNALLVGLLMGDGCYTKAVNAVNFSCFDPLLLQDTEEYLRSINLKFHKLRGHKGYYHVSQLVQEKSTRNKAGQFVRGYRNQIRRWLDERGMLNKYAHEKVMPDEVYKWNNDSVREIIAGLFVTDGSVFVNKQSKTGNPYLNYASTSLLLAKQVRDLLLWRFGVIMRGPRVNNYGGRKRPLYSLTASLPTDVLRFRSRIPLYGVKKQRFAAVCASRQPGQYDSVDSSYVERTSQNGIGLQPTFDIEVSNKDHIFVLANNLLVSNSSKHKGGVSEARQGASGFKVINQLAQVPKTFTGGAAHAQHDGRVSAIYDAPAGGKYVMIGPNRHYVATGFNPTVKPGDIVEAGDTISEGLPNPAEAVRHKGVGEGRRYFVDTWQQVFRNSGLKAERRNTELLARGLINHVRLTEEVGDYVPDDVVPYDVLERSYQPRSGHEIATPKSAVGRYLEKPVLHYSVGTKIRPSMLKNLDHFGVKSLVVHKDPPPFEPEMIRAMENLVHDQDWMARQLGSNLSRGLLHGAHRGATADEAGTSYVPSLARGIEFGRTGLTKGWKSASYEDIEFDEETEEDE